MKKGDYVNSDVYYKYCRNYDYDDCPIYKGNSSDSSCFLTSACVTAKGLPDNCYELQTLRQYRDNWLVKKEEGFESVLMYYEIAPRIVAAINSEKDSLSIYSSIYENMVKPCVAFIEEKKYEEAFELYKKVTMHLQAQYC